MSKTFLIVVIVLLLGALGGGAYYLYIRQIAQTQQSAAPFINPFTSSPTNSFADTGPTPTPSFDNPFASPSPTGYVNPFGSSTTGSQPYQNPFNALR